MDEESEVGPTGFGLAMSAVPSIVGQGTGVIKIG